MSTRFLILLNLFLVHYVTFANQFGDLINMNIVLEFDSSTNITDNNNGIPIIPLGYNATFTAKLINSSSEDIEIDDIRTSQFSLGHYKHSKFSEEGVIFFNPPVEKKNGLVVAPDSDTVTVKPGGYSEFKFTLYDFIMDVCLVPGEFNISVSYKEKRSNVCRFKIEFTNESVEKLLDILNDEKLDMWSRKEAYKWLKKVKPDFEYQFNENKVQDYRYWWNEQNKKALNNE